MSDKRDNLDKIGTYSTIRLPFELTAEQLSKLPPGKELHFDRAKQTVRGADYCYAVSRACYRTERSRSVTIASKTLGKIFADDPEQNVYRNRPRNWKQLAQIQAAEAAVKEAKTHQESTGTGVYSVQGMLGMLESAIAFRDDGTSFWDEGTKNGPDRSALLGHNFVYQETKPYGFYSSYFHQRISS